MRGEFQDLDFRDSGILPEKWRENRTLKTNKTLMEIRTSHTQKKTYKFRNITEASRVKKMQERV